MNAERTVGAVRPRPPQEGGKQVREMVRQQVRAGRRGAQGGCFFPTSGEAGPGGESERKQPTHVRANRSERVATPRPPSPSPYKNLVPEKKTTLGGSGAAGPVHGLPRPNNAPSQIKNPLFQTKQRKCDSASDIVAPAGRAPKFALPKPYEYPRGRIMVSNPKP